MFYDAATEIELKKAFGAALLRHPHNPYDAAREIEPTQSTGRANYIVNNWLDDPLVIATAGVRVASLGAKAGLPTKEELAVKIYREVIKDDATRLKYYQLVAELMGFIEKGAGVNINNNILNMPKVMKVPYAASEEEWERKTVERQRALAKL